jgi:hypothetical protein
VSCKLHTQSAFITWNKVLNLDRLNGGYSASSNIKDEGLTSGLVITQTKLKEIDYLLIDTQLAIALQI